ncbi:hypothetical protein Golomagni_02458 [Golovinomyces magnicellulatus]|nr:hypothetical protein Golomagni_02458 [Golovinomyces magnicellulatus]
MGRGVLDILLKLRIRKLSSAVENTSADSAPLLERTTSSSAKILNSSIPNKKSCSTHIRGM